MNKIESTRTGDSRRLTFEVSEEKGGRGEGEKKK